MSINTANLVTTPNGQAELAKVYSLNSQLLRDNRDIYVHLLFPYLAISSKTPEVVEGISSTTEALVKEEPCWAAVDICQVQTYAVESVVKRDFTIGGLFEVQNDIEHAVTIILYCQTQIVDNRSDAKKAEDGGRSATNILEQNYGYTTKLLPYAYTRILDNTGTYREGGVVIGASRYGRSRHRFYFNYIIDNNDGIADNITVDDNVYPYSDGYLSKTGFEHGLERYEKAIEKYSSDYEKFARSALNIYENAEDAIKHSAPGNKFSLESDSEILDPTFNAISSYIFNEYPIYNWEKYPPVNYSDNNEYKGVTAADYHTQTAVLDNNAEVTELLVLHPYFDKKPAILTVVDEYGSHSETKFLYFDISTMLFLRTPLMGLSSCQFVSTYNFVRSMIRVKIDNRLYDLGLEFQSDSSGAIKEYFQPFAPSFGKMEIIMNKVNNTIEMKISMLLNAVALVDTTPDSDGPRNIFESRKLFYKCSIVNNLVDGVLQNRVSESYVKTRTFSDYYDNYFIGRVTNTPGTGHYSAGSGTFGVPVQSNFAGGYVFSDLTNKNVYIVPKEFDADDMADGRLLPYEHVLTEDSCPLFTSIKNDVVHYMASTYRGYPLFLNSFRKKKSENSFISEGACSEVPEGMSSAIAISGLYYRGDYQFHNCRLIIMDNSHKYLRTYSDGVIAITKDGKNIESGTALVIIAIINDKFYMVNTTYGEYFDGIFTGSGIPTYFPNLFPLSVDITNGGSIMVTWSVTKLSHGNDGLYTNYGYSHSIVTRVAPLKIGTTGRWYPIESVDAYSKPARPWRVVAIEDCNGDINLIKETIGQ